MELKVISCKLLQGHQLICGAERSNGIRERQGNPFLTRPTRWGPVFSSCWYVQARCSNVHELWSIGIGAEPKHSFVHVNKQRITRRGLFGPSDYYLTSSITYERYDASSPPR
ncbi:hypothetical protein V3C99_017345 [Haemonchus contortus]|uniref:Uncharacterized protein n=1 Tax=Haemonchus contortus TaxID=6289 RepID=A0A7I5EEX7_HAECO